MVWNLISSNFRLPMLLSFVCTVTKVQKVSLFRKKNREQQFHILELFPSREAYLVWAPLFFVDPT